MLEITEGIMRRDDDALLRRDRGDLRLHLLVQSGKLGDIGVGIRGIGRAAGFVGLAKGAGYVLHVDLGILDGLPGMGIVLAVMVMSFVAMVVIVGVSRFVLVAGFLRLVVVSLLFLGLRMGVARGLVGKPERLDTLGQLDNRRLRAARFNQPLQKAFEFQAVDQHHIRLADGDSIGRARFVDMGIAIRPDERGDLHTIPTDIFREVGDDREAGDDLQFGGGSLRRQNR